MAGNREQIFVVHEHSASRLHYDLRLELEGVLKSWAIPKGPSMDPSDKRLAVMVPDHPLEYASWEGIIPEGNYGAGPVAIWDNGTYSLVEGTNPMDELNKGRIIFEFKGNILKGIFSLTRMKGKTIKGKEWLLIKKRDSFAQAPFKLERAITPERLKDLKIKVPPCATE